MEEWRAVPGYANFEASSLGRIRNRVTGTVRKPTWNARWRGRQICLDLNGRRRTFFVHQLVAMAFYGPCPTDHEVNHIDNNRENDCADNLEYLTHQKNMEHAAKQGRMARGERARASRLTAENVREIRQLYRKGVRGFGSPALAKRFGVAAQSIDAVIKGTHWGWLV